MKTITIRGVDNSLARKLKEMSREQSLSVNQFVLTSLRHHLGLDKEQIRTKAHHDLDHLFGSWTKKEFNEFEETQRDFETIDESLWT